MARVIRDPVDDDPKAREYYLNCSCCFTIRNFTNIDRARGPAGKCDKHIGYSIFGASKSEGPYPYLMPSCLHAMSRSSGSAVVDKAAMMVCIRSLSNLLPSYLGHSHAVDLGGNALS